MKEWKVKSEKSETYDNEGITTKWNIFCQNSEKQLA